MQIIVLGLLSNFLLSTVVMIKTLQVRNVSNKQSWAAVG